MKYLGKSVEKGIDWLSVAIEGFFDAITTGVDALVEALQAVLLYPHPLIIIALVSLLSYYASSKKYGPLTRAGWKAGRGMGFFTLIGLLILQREIVMQIVDVAVLKF